MKIAAGRTATGPVAGLVAEPASESAGGHATPVALPGVLRLLPEPVPVQVDTEAGRLLEVRGAGSARAIAAAEGPERLSGDWWKDPYRREYFRVCTVEGELLWLYREVRRSGELRWWLHGWWD